MTMTDDIVLRILSDEVSEEEARSQGLLAAEDEVRLDRLRELELALQSEADDVQAALAAVAPSRSVHQPTRLSPVEGSERRTNLSLIAGVLGALAASWCVWFFALRSTPDSAPVPLHLGAGQVEIRELHSTAEGGFDFSFEVVPPQEVQSHIRIWSADAPSGEGPLLEHRFGGMRWTPSATEQASLPDSIRWEVWVSDLSGSALATGSVPLATR